MNPARDLPLAFFALLAACGNNGSGPSVVVPTGLQAQPRATTVTLTWVDASPAETGFAVQRTEPGGVFQVVGEVGADVTRFEDTGLSPVTGYLYRVVVHAPGGVDQASAELAVTTVTPSVAEVGPPRLFDREGQRFTVRGDGFAAGVGAVRVRGVLATELTVHDDASLSCSTPRLPVPGPAKITVETPSATLEPEAALEVVAWPPDLRGRLAPIVAGTASPPADVQMLSAGALSVMVWSESEPGPAVFASASEFDGGWSRPLRISGEGSPFHPHAAVDPEGERLCVAWVDHGELRLVTSTDRGRTFAGPVRVPAALGTVFSPRVAVHGNRVHLVWADEREHRGELYHNHSTDGGRTFQPLPMRLNRNPGAYDMQLAVDGPLVHVLWWSPFGVGGVYHARSIDGGDTWPGSDRLLTLLPGTERASPPRLAVAGEHVYVLSQEGGDARVAFLRSTDRGDTFAAKLQIDRDDRNSSDPRMAVTPNGSEVYVVWEETDAVELNRSLDGGASFLVRPVRVVRTQGAVAADPVLCCNGSVVTLALALDAAGSSRVHCLGSFDWGLSWAPLGELGVGRRPNLHCHGADIVLSWQADQGLSAARSRSGQGLR